MVSRDQRSLLAVDLIEARRDVVEELTRRGSAIRRVLSDLEVDVVKRAELEEQLAALGAEIVANSATLDSIRGALEELEEVVGTVGKPALSPLPVRLEELARSVSIDLDTGSGGLPMRLHGLGSRSLSSLQMQGVMYNRRLGVDGPALRPHPLTLIEEPEAHLHPQASIELAGLLTGIRGQVVATTHSPQVVTAVEARCLRVIREDAGVTKVFDLGPTDDMSVHRHLRPCLHAEEMEKLRRLVERPFGEVLFASVVVMGDGATERSFLPIVLRHAVGSKAHGVCVIDPGSLGGALAPAVVKFANLVDAPWFIFSDTDDQGQKAANKLVDDFAGGDASHIVWVDEAGALADPAGDGAIERLMASFDDQMCIDACVEMRPDADQTKSALDLLKDAKGSVGATLARRFVQKYPNVDDWPECLRTLVERLNDAV